ncbi:MAG TPA: hypothetical protein VGD96_02280 [Bradyrhizobium sp.]
MNTNVEYERLTKVPACRSTGSEPICTLSVQLLKEDEEWQEQHGDAFLSPLGKEATMYALFEGNKQIGSPFPTEKEVWEAALIEGLVTDVPVADGAGGQILPKGYHVAEVNEARDPQRDRKLPREIS